MPSLQGIGRDGRSVVVYFNKGDNQGEFREISANGTVGPALDPDARLDRSPLFHPVTQRLAGFRYADDWPRDDYFDPVLKNWLRPCRRSSIPATVYGLSISPKTRAK